MSFSGTARGFVAQMAVTREGLDVLLPVVGSWFRATFGVPTPPQRLGWPAIASGENTLLFAPTGSGKTLAAFLACLDHLWRVPRQERGVRVLYVSPLKALNQDIERNLRPPLEGILREATNAGVALPSLEVAVRSGDTPASERQRMVRKPPDILITTPESLHLLLTSRARDTLRSISHVIVDEIHALCPNKRGVFLALLLERLEAVNPKGFVRIGLSATQRPLDEVARYLGGCRKASGTNVFEPRPVTIVDAGQRKQLDLEVMTPFDRPGPYPAGTVWPAIESKLQKLIREHRSTIVFTNNKRVAERLTAHLNERAELDETPLVTRAHHGSLSLEERRGTEEALKNGELAAVVATATLELGIDMGAVDLVCQVESPGSVARGLQRVGRAGHIVGRTSKGRLIAKTSSDLLESAALCRMMPRGAVEPLHVPTGCLDVLAQQVVACVAMDRWDVTSLFDLVRCAYPYRDLTPDAFESVLAMISGRFATGAFRDLRARIEWDRLHNRLHPLPGTARLALVGGGTIPESGHFPVYLGEGGPRLGELDEEFVLERRVGETFTLGTSSWRIETIDPHRVIVSRAEGQSAQAPFWRGEMAARTPELGEEVGLLSREIAERLNDPTLETWLAEECRLDPVAAQSLRDFIARQKRVAGCVPDDRTVLIESFHDPSGEVGLAVLTPFGGKLHQGLKIVLQSRLRERLGIAVAGMHGDEGVVLRLPQTEEPPLDLFRGLSSESADELLRAEVGESALFGLRFRQNAGRALLMPRPDPTKRTPLWLQRLRAKDLLQVIRKFPDHPIFVETYRECLNDDLDLPRLRRFLDGIKAGTINVVSRRGEIPSPFLSELLLRFTLQYLYEWDEPRRPDRPNTGSAVNDSLLDVLLDPAARARWIDPSAVARVENRLKNVGQPPRSADEMAETLRRLGDLTPSELAGPMNGFLVELEAQGRARTIEVLGAAEPERWISAEEEPLYRAAVDACREDREDPSLSQVVRRFLQTHALIGLDELLARYPMSAALATELLEHWTDSGEFVRIDSDGSESPRWADRRNLAEVNRISLALRRRESIAVPPETFADLLLRRQHIHTSTRLEGAAAVECVLEQLQGFAVPADVWESELLPRRVACFRASALDAALSTGAWCWRAQGEARGEPRVALVARDFSGHWPAPEAEDPISEREAHLIELLRTHGASFATDLARQSGIEPSKIRGALDSLLRRGVVTNDRFDPLRPSARAMSEALATAAQSRRSRFGRPSSRRLASQSPEGRWSLCATAEPNTEESIVAWIAVLLDRYGVLTRETAALDAWAPPWRDLAPCLARAELRGDLRRGYFVEGLSGVQYATSEMAEELSRWQPASEPVLISTLDPANLYGAGAPFDVSLLEGGTARLPRSAGNYLVLCAGRPVLIIEGNGKRLTGLASASENELKKALALLPSLAGTARRVLKVETYNTAATLASPAAPWLAEVGFVRDHPGMAYYAGW